MNPNDSSVASELRPEGNTSPVFRNGVVAAPDTHTARVNSAALLRASQDVGYTAVVFAQRGIKAMREAAL